MRKTLVGALFCVGLTSLAMHADAAANGNGLVNSIQIVGTQYAVVNIGGISGSRPACHNGLLGFLFSLDLGTTKGRALLSSLTSMQLARRSVLINGSGACLNVGSPFNNIESISILEMD